MFERIGPQIVVQPDTWTEISLFLTVPDPDPINAFVTIQVTNYFGNIEVDDFSLLASDTPLTTPEPGCLGVVGLGCAAIFALRCRRRLTV
jgi:hypothetical protein